VGQPAFSAAGISLCQLANPLQMYMSMPYLAGTQPQISSTQ